jgi:hypothetical protein
MRCSRSVRVDVSEVAAAECQAGFGLLVRYERPAGVLGAWCLSLDASGSPNLHTSRRLGARPRRRRSPNCLRRHTNASALTRDERVAFYHSRNQNELPSPHNTSNRRQYTASGRHICTRQLKDTHTTHTNTRWIAKQYTRSTFGESRRARCPLARRATIKYRRSWSTSSCHLLSTMLSYTGMSFRGNCHGAGSNTIAVTRSGRTSCQNNTSATSTSHI